MCGLAGAISLDSHPIYRIDKRLAVMSELIAHRGPDGNGQWRAECEKVGLVHRRLAVIDLTQNASQPMQSRDQCVITYNGEIYNYKELNADLRTNWPFETNSDTETILAAYAKYGFSCLDHFRGMFAFAIWDPKKKVLFCARDRFGIKPLYYTIVEGVLYFASEAKALLPFLPEIKTSKKALAEYLTFQYSIGENTLFDGIYQLMPGHALKVQEGKLHKWRYWDVNYDVDHNRSPAYFDEKLGELMEDSISLHLRSDVQVGSYVSGGVDSSLMHLMANRLNNGKNPLAFHGRFKDYEGHDESHYAEYVTNASGGTLNTIDISSKDFLNNIESVIYHLDFPVAGPGAFSQYMVSFLAAKYIKVVLGGQGGDEIFGGYARYLIAYFEQCIKAALDGQYENGNFVVTLESIVPNLGQLREYKPLIKEFWKSGLFDPMDQRYFRLINRSNDMENEIQWDLLDTDSVFEDFCVIFNNSANVKKDAYLDKMTHFDFKCSIPALLHVEDRMSMAHGLESRVPFLDHPLIEFAATVPADIKFSGGKMKRMLKRTFANDLPNSIVNRRDKMGFPVPLKEWFDNELRDFALDTFRSMASKDRPFIVKDALLKDFGETAKFSRKTWGLISLELWYQQFHDKSLHFRRMIS